MTRVATRRRSFSEFICRRNKLLHNWPMTSYMWLGTISNRRKPSKVDTLLYFRCIKAWELFLSGSQVIVWLMPSVIRGCNCAIYSVGGVELFTFFWKAYEQMNSSAVICGWIQQSLPPTQLFELWSVCWWLAFLAHLLWIKAAATTTRVNTPRVTAKTI